jgi:hypothetical protein
MEGVVSLLQRLIPGVLTWLRQRRAEECMGAYYLGSCRHARFEEYAEKLVNHLATFTLSSPQSLHSESRDQSLSPAFHSRLDASLPPPLHRLAFLPPTPPFARSPTSRTVPTASPTISPPSALCRAFYSRAVELVHHKAYIAFGKRVWCTTASFTRPPIRYTYPSRPSARQSWPFIPKMSDSDDDRPLVGTSITFAPHFGFS